VKEAKATAQPSGRLWRVIVTAMSKPSLRSSAGFKLSDGSLVILCFDANLGDLLMGLEGREVQPSVAPEIEVEVEVEMEEV